MKKIEIQVSDLEYKILKEFAVMLEDKITEMMRIFALESMEILIEDMEQSKSEFIKKLSKDKNKHLSKIILLKNILSGEISIDNLSQDEFNKIDKEIDMLDFIESLNYDSKVYKQ